MLKRYFLTGLLIWVPLVITAWVLSIFINTMDQTLHLLPPAVHPRNLFGFEIPGAGVALTLGVIFLTGLVTTNIIGQRLVEIWEFILHKIPVVNSVYKSVKQVSDTLFSSDGNAFRKALLVQYPRQGSWTIAFQTGSPAKEVATHLNGEHISVYIPTTPNPTSGFFLMMPITDVIELNMTVDAALKHIISMGVVAPLEAQAKLKKPLPNTAPATPPQNLNT